MLADELSVLLGQPINKYRENVLVNCPLHDDRVASMSINLRKGVFYCWGCGKGGGLRTLAQILGGDLQDADLAISSVVTEPDEEEAPDFSEKLNSFDITKLEKYSWYHWPKILDLYARSRKLAVIPIGHFDLRWDSVNNRIVMPYYDGSKVVALRYRGPNGEKTYEPGSKRILYNVNDIRGASKVILCEGESDTHKMYNEYWISDYKIGGVPGANSSRQTWELWALDLMWADEIQIAFDNDKAGDTGAARAIEVLGDKAVRCAPPAPYVDWSEALLAGCTLGL